jgi:PiT family inorganic phosphate transporter
MNILADSLPMGGAVFLVLAIGLALAFEFVNGFHDTANAVATVIYTNTLPPWVAVIWSGLWNLLGVVSLGGAVAFSVLALLPTALVINIGSSTGFAMIFALLISAILWNLGTWYLGLPASSSHTLIGSIMGVGVANAIWTAGHITGEGVNWSKATEVFSSLLISPIIGFLGAALLLLIAKAVIRKPQLFAAPPRGTPPPTSIRALLVLTCTGVSFAHGSNDGQKGMGLLVLILIGILPGTYALNMNTSANDLRKLQTSAQVVNSDLRSRSNDTPALTSTQASQALSDYLKTGGMPGKDTYSAFAALNDQLVKDLAGKNSLSEFSDEQRKPLRNEMYLLSATIAKLQSQKQIQDSQEAKALAAYKQGLTGVTQFIPLWVKVAVACALGFGTMIGWKRIVVTVGEKIGKEHLTYAQGASAELVAMCTIGVATFFGLPVSTTHVLSSGVAGTMAANHSGLQMRTLRNIALAWLFTLPVSLILGGAIFSATLFVIFITPLGRILFLAGLIALALVAWWLWRTLTRPISREMSMVDAK